MAKNYLQTFLTTLSRTLVLNLLNVFLGQLSLYHVPSPYDYLRQWFSTFLSLRHTIFKTKIGGTIMCKKDTKRMKIWLLLYNFFEVPSFGGTPGKNWQLTCVSRHTGWETLINVFVFQLNYWRVWESNLVWRWYYFHLALRGIRTHDLPIVRQL
jgi:hypothetical protein